MGKIISVVGNLGAGKTTLSKLICDKGSFSPYWENPIERPFHAEYDKNHQRWALANQIDFFLFRCEQETIARKNADLAIFDGGFDQDYHVYTKYIFNRGFLNQEEFNLCKRFYYMIREFLPPPDVFIRVMVDISTLIQRRSVRARKTDDHFFDVQELTDFELLIDEWFEHEMTSPVLKFSFEHDFHSLTKEVDELILQITEILALAS